MTVRSRLWLLDAVKVPKTRRAPQATLKKVVTLKSLFAAEQSSKLFWQFSREQKVILSARPPKCDKSRLAAHRSPSVCVKGLSSQKDIRQSLDVAVSSPEKKTTVQTRRRTITRDKRLFLRRQPRHVRFFVASEVPLLEVPIPEKKTYQQGDQSIEWHSDIKFHLLRSECLLRGRVR